MGVGASQLGQEARFHKDVDVHKDVEGRVNGSAQPRNGSAAASEAINDSIV